MRNITDPPPYRPLKVYAFDPSIGRNLGNYMTINVPYERLTTGPVGEYLAVIDYDATHDTYYEPVNLDDPEVLIRGGLDPSESDPRFHQQMVYAVASETIRRFRLALGRRPKWGFRERRNAEDGEDTGDDGTSDPHVRKLRVFPHALQEANAFYSRDLKALVFGYFPASESDPGVNLPGQTIFTCLSHDIIVHETTHALIDGQRRFFMETTSPDTPAFHEAFADIVALFQHFSFTDALLDVIQRTGGLIYRPQGKADAAPTDGAPMIAAELSTENPLVQLARQFGEAMGMRSALRSAIGTPPNSKALETTFEPHDRGAILVAAVFDAFFSVYVRRTRDLMRIAGLNGNATEPGNLHHDLANRLADHAAKIARQFSTICIRALDYCPPVDIRFGDFLRALITADYDMAPDDPYGYRSALIEAFRLRGIRPDRVASYAEESLRWCPPEVLKEEVNEPVYCKGLDFDPTKPPTPDQLKNNARILSRFGGDNAVALGLRPGHPVQAHSFHPMHRVGPDGQVHFNVVAELVQQTTVPFDPSEPDGEKFTFRGGSTVIFDNDGRVIYSIQKSLGDDPDASARLAEQRAYLGQLDERSAMSVFIDADHSTTARFDLIHRGF